MFKSILVLAILLTFFLPNQSQGQLSFFSSWQKTDWRLIFTTAAQNTLNRSCSGVVTVQTGIGTGFARPVSSNLTVNLTSNSGTTVFYSDRACTTPVTFVTVLTGASTASFYYYDSVAGTPTLTASAAGYVNATQTATLTANPYIWVGGTNSDWSTGSNWSGGSPPGTSNTAVFTSGCINCNPTFSANIDIGGIRMDAGYTGIIQQDTVYNLSFRTGGFVQVAGTFIGSSDAARTMTVNGNGSAQYGEFVLSGGSFTAPVGTLTVTNNWRIVGSPTFVAPVGSTVSLSCATNGHSCDSASYAMDFGGISFHHLIFRPRSGNINLSGSTATVVGDLTTGDYESVASMNNGTLLLYGNLSVASTFGSIGDMTIRLKGNGSGQTIVGSGVQLPHVEIDAGANSVTLTGEVRVARWTMTTVGTFTVTGSTLHIRCTSSSGSACYAVTVFITPGAVDYNHVIISTYRTAAFNFGGGTFNVNGDFSFGATGGTTYCALDNGTIKVQGNVSNYTGTTGGFGSAYIELIGSVAGQTITGGATSSQFPRIIVNASANPITLVDFVSTRGWELNTVGSFTSTGSTLRVVCSNGVAFCNLLTMNVIPNSVTYNHVQLDSYRSNFDFGGGTMNVDGNLSIGASGGATWNQLNNGTLRVKGDLSQTGTGGYGSATIQMIGNPSGQTITGLVGAYFPIVEIVAGVNNITLSGTVRVVNWIISSIGALGTTGSTLQIGCPSSGLISCYTTVQNVVLGTHNYNNLTFSGLRTSYDLGGATINVGGNLNFGDISLTNREFRNGTLLVAGDVSINNNGNIGNAQIQFVGSANSILTVATTATRPTGLITVAKTGGAIVTQASNVTWSSAGQSMTISSGNWNQAGYSLSVNNVLTLDTGTTLNQAGGSLSYGSLVNNGTIIP